MCEFLPTVNPEKSKGMLQYLVRRPLVLMVLNLLGSFLGYETKS